MKIQSTIRITVLIMMRIILMIMTLALSIPSPLIPPVRRHNRRLYRLPSVMKYKIDYSRNMRRNVTMQCQLYFTSNIVIFRKHNRNKLEKQVFQPRGTHKELRSFNTARFCRARYPERKQKHTKEKIVTKGNQQWGLGLGGIALLHSVLRFSYNIF